MIEQTVDKDKADKIDKIEIEYLKVKDFEALKKIMIAVYPTIVDPYWSKSELQKLARIFPEGQVVVKVNGEIAGCALSIIVDYDKFSDKHTYAEITGDATFSTHTPKGNVLYGIDIFIAHEFRGMRIGRRLYDYRKELCENMNLERIVFGGRLPNYHQYANKMSPKEYIENVRNCEISDPVLDFQLNNDFHVKRVITNYLEGDKASKEYAALLEWDNIYYQKPQKNPIATKTVVRLGLVQWQMRNYKNLDELIEQAEYFIDTISGYRSDFVLFPEFFNAPLMAAYNHLSEADAIRELAKYTDQIRDKFSELSISYNINIISGSMPYLEDGKLYNVGFLCKRDGTVEKFYKLHVTPDEAKVWGMNGGDVLKTFNTDCGKIGILICYDVEFPELSRLLADQGMDILFVPFLTDTQNAYSRVRLCAQARAVENECYVAIAGSIGNIPKVHNMDVQFAQSMVLTPCDFQFPTNGIKAEATPNAEMILVADVDVDLLKELNQFGSVHNLNDRRKDLFSLKLKKKQNGLKEPKTD
jgi:predicted amidohydrolase/ribosomal protein S18 acetylase RimI-like enzyme